MSLDPFTDGTAPTTTVLDTALSLASRGWHIFPVDHPSLPQCAGLRTAAHDPATCTQRGKHPCVKWTMAATTEPKMIRSWLSQGPRNLGIHCGKSGLVVLDEDVPGELLRYAIEHGHALGATHIVQTGRGRHYYFLAPPGVALGNGEGAFGPYDINIRAGNGYVVAEGSQHANGATYVPVPC